MMVPLLPRYHLRDAWQFNRHVGFIFLARSLPFYRSRRGAYVHRVRSGEISLWDGKPRGAIYALWCGMSGFGSKGALLSAPGAHDVVCATCEGRAIGSGQLGAPLIAGKPVRFAPRLHATPGSVR